MQTQNAHAVQIFFSLFRRDNFRFAVCGNAAIIMRFVLIRRMPHAAQKGGTADGNKGIFLDKLYTMPFDGHMEIENEFIIPGIAVIHRHHIGIGLIVQRDAVDFFPIQNRAQHFLIGNAHFFAVHFQQGISNNSLLSAMAKVNIFQPIKPTVSPSERPLCAQTSDMGHSPSVVGLAGKNTGTGWGLWQGGCIDAFYAFRCREPWRACR